MEERLDVVDDRVLDALSAEQRLRPAAGPRQAFGEAERSTFRSIKEPTLLYGYICALRPERRAARIQIHTRTLRDEREHWIKDQLDRFLGKVLSRLASAEMLIEGEVLRVRRLSAHENDQGKDIADDLFVKLGDPVIEVNNDQVPEGLVIQQDPAPGTKAEPETSVTLVVSRGG